MKKPKKIKITEKQTITKVHTLEQKDEEGRHQRRAYITEVEGAFRAVEVKGVQYSNGTIEDWIFLKEVSTFIVDKFNV